MLTFLMNGVQLKRLKRTLTYDQYLDFLVSFLSMFDMSKVKRKKMTGDHFKL